MASSISGGDIYFEFSANGKATYSIRTSETDSYNYKLVDDAIYNESFPKEPPMKIASLSADVLVLHIEEKDKPVVMP